MFSFAYFPGVRLSFADVSKPSVRSIFKGWMKNILQVKFADVSAPSVRSIFKGWMKNILQVKFADVSAISVRSIFKGWMKNNSETSVKLNLTPGKYPKENIRVSDHGENLKSSTVSFAYRCRSQTECVGAEWQV
jgi:molybdopterin-binding protein